MGVESHMFERFKCDRCPNVADIANGDIILRSDWSHLTAQGYQGRAILTTLAPDGYKLTLCPTCTSALIDWAGFHRRKGDAKT